MGWGVFSLMREARAALVAAGTQHIAPCSAGHTFEETMFPGAVSLLWLVGSFWHLLQDSHSAPCCVIDSGEINNN